MLEKTIKESLLQKISEKFYEYNISQLALSDFEVDGVNYHNPILMKKNNIFFLDLEKKDDNSVLSVLVVLLEEKILEQILKIM